MTYYELVSYLDSLIIKPITDREIEYLNNSMISLSGDRYLRFIEHLSYLITERFKTYLTNISDKMGDSYLDSQQLTIELSTLKEEVNIANKLSSIKLVKEENQKELKKSIIKGNNVIIDTIRTVFVSDEERLNVLNTYELKEIE